MFGLIVDAALRNRLLVLAAAALLVVCGAYTLPGLPVDVFPDLNKPTVTLMTEAEGLAPEEVEQLVNFPIETAMNGIPGFTRVRSVSGVGLGIVTVEFDWGTDLYRNRQQVAERLAVIQSQLPPGIRPQMGPITSIMGEILLIALTPGAATPMAVREVADWVVRPRLLAIPGVGEVIPIGGEIRQYRVTPNPARLAELAVPIETVVAALRAFGTNTGGGFVNQHGQEYLIRNIGRTTRIDDLRDLVIAWEGQQPILLHQVATVDFAARVKRGDAGVNGRPAVILSVQKQPAADTVRLTEAIESALAALTPSLPDGIRADRMLFRQADFIATSIHNVETVLVEALAVITVVLFLFLLNVRTTLISLTAIPIAILITVLVFQILGMSINTMTLGGLAIAIGELVDDAVVDVENIFRRLGENRRLAAPRPILAVVAAASNEVRSGIVVATLIIILVFVPLFALSGIEGRLFAPLGVAYIVSILASLITAITVTPVLSYYLLPRLKRLDQHDGGLVRLLKAANTRLLGVAFAYPGPLIGGIALTVVVTAATVPGLPRAFLPPFNEGTLTIGMALTPGISLAESNRVGQAAERLILEVPEVISVGRRTGRAERDEHAEGVHASELDVDLRPSARTRAEILAEMRSRLAALPVAVNVGQPISHRLDHLLSGVRAEIALKLFGDDLDTLRTLADDLHQRLAKIPGLVDLQIEKQVLIPQVQVVIDYRQAALYGVTPALATEILESVTNGRVVSEVIDGNRRFEVVLRLAEIDRTTAGLTQLLVETPAGRVPLGLFARVEETDGPNQILRENGKRRIVILGNGDGRTDPAAIVDAIRRELAVVPLPTGFFAALEGSFQAQETASQLIAGLSLVSLSLIFLVLYSRYRSGVLALIIMGNVPLALIGSVAALWISGQPLSVASMIGFITLTGIATRNGILKISHYINLALHEGVPFGPALVMRGSQERLTPVLMTALSAGVALVPLLIGADAPGKEILHPVAVTIFGGLISATVLDTVLTPVLFLTYGRPPLTRLSETAAGESRPAEAY